MKLDDVKLLPVDPNAGLAEEHIPEDAIFEYRATLAVSVNQNGLVMMISERSKTLLRRAGEGEGPQYLNE